MVDLAVILIYMSISCITMFLLVFMQRLRIINQSSDFGIILGGFFWWFVYPILIWVLFYEKALKPIFSIIKGDAKCNTQKNN